MIRLLLKVSVLFATGAAAQAAPSTGARPNILFALADDWSYPHASVYGTPWVQTPHFDRVVREGLLFTRAYTPNAKCGPSRSSILTGRNSWQLGAAANHYIHFPPEIRTVTEALAELGYQVAYTGKGWSPGSATYADGRPRDLIGRAFNGVSTPPPTDGISQVDYAANFAAFLDAAEPGAPWFFWYGSHEPHRKYEYKSGMTKGGKAVTDLDRVPGYWPDDPVVRHDILDYAYEVEHFDRHLGLMLAELERRDLTANTIVIVTSDNGMPFPRVKGQPYEASMHMPLAIRWPQGVIAPGRIVADYVSFIDFAPTFVDAAGADWESSGLASSPGRSLMPLLTAEQPAASEAWRTSVVVGQERHDPGRPGDTGYPVRGLVKDGWLYLINFRPNRWPAGDPITGYLNVDSSPTKSLILEHHRTDADDLHWHLCFGKRGTDELYHVEGDPDCLANYASDPLQADRVAAMRDILLAALVAEEDPRMRGRGDELEQHPFARDEMNDFYERWLAGTAEQPRWVSATDFELPPGPGGTCPHCAGETHARR